MTNVTVADVEAAFHPDNWDNPRNFDPVLIAEAKKAWEALEESLKKSRERKP